MKRIQLVINNDVKKYREEFFIKGELKCILNLYAKMVSNGSWKDYGLKISSKQVAFSVFKNSSEKIEISGLLRPAISNMSEIPLDTNESDISCLNLKSGLV